jgi:hypothetical protein
VNRSALALSVQAAPAHDLAPLRRRLSGATARESVVVDFLEDDLREAEAAIADARAWLEEAVRAVCDARAGRADIVEIAARDPSGSVEYLGEMMQSVRRRLAQVAYGIERAGA